MSSNSVPWKSEAGATYNFVVCPYGERWNNVGGVYAFAYQNAAGTWFLAYVGQTADFSRDLPGHKKWPEARMLGATHVLACPLDEEATRESVERELIRAMHPRLNEKRMAA